MKTVLRNLRHLLPSVLVAAIFAGTLALPFAAVAGTGSDLQFAGVRATVTKIPLRISEPSLMDELRAAGGDFSYEITFGKLSREQFDRLVNYFRKSEPLTYNAEAHYTLVDFLPGKMQALLHKRLVMTVRNSPELDEVDLFYKNAGEILGTINCWGTAWEMARDASVNSPLCAFLSSRRFTQEVMQSQGARVEAENAQFGDVLLWFADPQGDRKLQHAATYLGHGYYFERTDPGSAMFFRIVHLEDMRARLNEAFGDFEEDLGQKVQVSFELRRFDSPLANPIEVFSAASTAEVGHSEYVGALPASENKSRVTVFSDDRMGGGNEVVLADILTFMFRLNPATGRGEVDPTEKCASLLVKAD